MVGRIFSYAIFPSYWHRFAYIHPKTNHTKNFSLHTRFNLQEQRSNILEREREKEKEKQFTSILLRFQYRVQSFCEICLAEMTNLPYSFSQAALQRMRKFFENICLSCSKCLNPLSILWVSCKIGRWQKPWKPSTHQKVLNFRYTTWFKSILRCTALNSSVDSKHFINFICLLKLSNGWASLTADERI